MFLRGQPGRRGLRKRCSSTLGGQFLAFRRLAAPPALAPRTHFLISTLLALRFAAGRPSSLEGVTGPPGRHRGARAPGSRSGTDDLPPPRRPPRRAGIRARRRGNPAGGLDGNLVPPSSAPSPPRLTRSRRGKAGEFAPPSSLEPSTQPLHAMLLAVGHVCWPRRTRRRDRSASTWTPPPQRKAE